MVLKLELEKFEPLSSERPAMVGDVVKMRIGGPLMTVEGGVIEICCVWFDSHNKLYRSRFKRELLIVRVSD